MEELVPFSVIIVSRNTCELTMAAIRSVLRQDDPRVELLVVDNASNDDTLQKICALFPNARLIVNDSNLGFAAANNIGMRVAKGDYFLLLNSDAELMSPNLFSTLLARFSRYPSIAVIGGKLVLPSGRVQAMGRTFLSLKRVFKEQLLFASAKPVKPARIDYVDGAFMAVRRAVVEQVGGFDERFFMYSEDMEWCLRIKNAGWRIAVLPELVIKHHHGAAAKQNFRAMLFHSIINGCRFIERLESPSHAQVAYDVFLAGMMLRIPLSFLRRNGLTLEYLCAVVTGFKMRKQLKRLLRGGQ